MAGQLAARFGALEQMRSQRVAFARFHGCEFVQQGGGPDDPGAGLDTEQLGAVFGKPQLAALELGAAKVAGMVNRRCRVCGVGLSRCAPRKPPSVAVYRRILYCSCCLMSHW